MVTVNWFWGAHCELQAVQGGGGDMEMEGVSHRQKKVKVRRGKTVEFICLLFPVVTLSL